MFTANAAWPVLVVLAFNLTRAAAALSGRQLATATTAPSAAPTRGSRPDRQLGPMRRAGPATRLARQQAWTLLSDEPAPARPGRHLIAEPPSGPHEDTGRTGSEAGTAPRPKPKQPSGTDQDQLGTGYRWIRAKAQ